MLTLSPYPNRRSRDLQNWGYTTLNGRSNTNPKGRFVCGAAIRLTTGQAIGHVIRSIAADT